MDLFFFFLDQCRPTAGIVNLLKVLCANKTPVLCIIATLVLQPWYDCHVNSWQYGLIDYYKFFPYHCSQQLHVPLFKPGFYTFHHLPSLKTRLTLDPCAQEELCPPPHFGAIATQHFFVKI